MIRLVTLAGLLALAASAAQAQTADAAAGAVLFKQRCGVCHGAAAGEKKPMGPNLHGVVGRKAATGGDFPRFTPALKASAMTWTAASLDGFLAAPGKAVPGTSMMIAVPSAKDRADIVAYLASLK